MTKFTEKKQILTEIVFSDKINIDRNFLSDKR